VNRATSLGLLMLVASCSGQSEHGKPLGDFRAGYMDALCSFAVRCRVAPDEATCRGAYDVIAPNAVLAVAVSEAARTSRLGYDPAAAAACLETLRDLPCDSRSSPFIGEPACGAVFVAKVPLGGPCVIDEECTSGWCYPSDPNVGPQCLLGTCMQQQPDVAIGGSCEGGRNCVAGALCNSDLVCAVPLDTLGAPCSTNDDCAAPLVCDTQGCQPQAATGGACTPGRIQPCVDYNGTYCDPTTQVCTKRGEVGDPCVPDDVTGLEQLCPVYSFCDRVTMKCTLPGARGAPCATDVVAPCLGVLQCDVDSQTCLARLAAEACM
jgi:hypothetical protein